MTARGLSRSQACSPLRLPALKAVMCGDELQPVGSTRKTHREGTRTERGEWGGGMRLGNLGAAEKQGTAVHPSQLEVNKQINK